MAKSGTINKTIKSGYTFQLVWEETAVNTAANTSTVKVTAKLITGSYGTIQSSASKAISITVDGTKKSGTCVIGNMSGNTTKTLYSATFTVAHNSDGSKTAAISSTFDFNITLSGTYYGTQTASGNAVLTKIAKNPSAPTTFSITAGYGNYVGLGDTITLKWSGASGTITGYELQYAYGNSGWLAWKTQTGTSTTVSFGRTDINQTGAGKQIRYRVRALNGSLTSAWKESNALIMSGGMNLKVSNSWQTGSVWINVNGTWRRAKRVWIKVNGTWQYSK